MTEKQKITVGCSILSTQLETTIGDDTEESILLQTLIYLGQDGKCFTLGYREFVDGRAREPFRENAIYQNPPTSGTIDIAYRNALIRIHTASNTHLEFEVLNDCKEI